MKGQQTLLKSKLCRMDQCRFDVHRPQGRITAKNLVASGAFGQAVENYRNGNSGICGTQLAVANCGIPDQMFAPFNHGFHPMTMMMATLNESRLCRKRSPRRG